MGVKKILILDQTVAKLDSIKSLWLMQWWFYELFDFKIEKIEKLVLLILLSSSIWYNVYTFYFLRFIKDYARYLLLTWTNKLSELNVTPRCSILTVRHFVIHHVFDAFCFSSFSDSLTLRLVIQVHIISRCFMINIWVIV